MSLFGDVKTCGICSVRATAGQGQAIFTAECSHSFHFNCISSYVGNGNNNCPTCHVKWNDLPFPTTRNPFTNNNNNMNHNPFNTNPFQFSPFPAYQLPKFPTFEAEPARFSDDEPLLAPTSDANATSSVCLNIKATAERPAVLASESVSLFPVLVGIKAPLVSNSASNFQRAPVDLVTVLDVSGSMSGHKLDLVKRAVLFVIDNLGPSDRLSIVSFSTNAQRISRLRRMTESGRENAKQAVASLYASGGTNIVEGLKKGVRVLEERLVKNPVSSIMFLSDGNDTCNHGSGMFGRPTMFSSRSQGPPEYLNLLPVSIRPRNGRPLLDESFLVLDGFKQQTFPVHSFGFGSDHDPIAMHAISDSSGGTFSFIQSFEMVQDAFANCIGGLLSVVIQELRVTVRAASHGVEIKSIPSGRYVSNISNNGSEGIINVGDMYAEEDRQFLVYMSIPVLQNHENDETEGKTSLLDVACSYKDVVTKEMVEIEADLVEIRRPNILSPVDMVVNIEVDRQKNRVLVAESIAEAQKKAELGDLFGARAILSDRQSDLVSSASGQAGDSLCTWLGAEINETRERMGNMNLYQQSGRAFALAGMSSHVSQRATTKGNTVPGSDLFGLQSASHSSASFGAAAPAFGAYSTPFMQQMVDKSQQQQQQQQQSKTPFMQPMVHMSQQQQSKTPFMQQQQQQQLQQQQQIKNPFMQSRFMQQMVHVPQQQQQQQSKTTEGNSSSSSSAPMEE